MPSKEVMVKMIRRATQIKDPISELNHKEWRTDMRNLEEGETETLTVQVINNQAVVSGFDIKFNTLRVLPPSDFEYPDIMRDGESFFDKINCCHLKKKYPPAVNEGDEATYSAKKHEMMIENEKQLKK